VAPQPRHRAGDCEAQLGDFVGSMARLRSNLVGGLDYEGYVAEVKAIERAYRRIPVDALALSCLRAAGTPGERALNRYIAAANSWTDCVEAPSCQSVSIEAELQRQWRLASGNLSKAQRGLRRLSSS
ncbi:MAG: hypothetical protein ACM3NV_09775, partial [Syntrophothermus sp.]